MIISTNKFKNNLLVIWISQLLPYILMIGYLWYSIILNEQEQGRGHLISSILILTCWLIFVMIYKYVDHEYSNYVWFFPFNSKIIYSQYGNFILIKGSNYFRLYENKYWIFLSPISSFDERIRFYEDSDNIDIGSMKIKVLELIRSYIRRTDERTSTKNRNKDVLNRWNGSVDQVSNREKIIDDLQ